jgi:hypothetical protein
MNIKSGNDFPMRPARLARTLVRAAVSLPYLE